MLDIDLSGEHEANQCELTGSKVFRKSIRRNERKSASAGPRALIDSRETVASDRQTFADKRLAVLVTMPVCFVLYLMRLRTAEWV